MFGEQNYSPVRKFLAKLWQVLFVLIYPVLITFSLIFTVILLIFSSLSQLMFRLLNGASPKEPVNKSKASVNL
jgi:hypothetical protein